PTSRTNGPTLFPYTTLFRSLGDRRVALAPDDAFEHRHRRAAGARAHGGHAVHEQQRVGHARITRRGGGARQQGHGTRGVAAIGGDRKSTRLNSSHRTISYAV